MNIKREDVRNVAIIAHVDHGKTTLVDQLLKQSGVFRENQEVQERVMDSNDIERERGITILSKNTAVHYKGVKINIIDTPGHADFGGEVERVLKMVDGVILLVDAFEGAMPQTKFVLKKALELDLHVIVCINKIDRPEARPDEVIDEVLELLIDLGASDEQLDCPFLFASARDGYATYNIDDEPKDMVPLFETILDYIPAPEGDPDAGTQMLISTIDYNEYVGRIGVGKVDNGTISVNQDVVVVNHHDPDKQKKVKISKLYEFDGLNKVEVKEAGIGSIVAISGIADISIGDTICAPGRKFAFEGIPTFAPEHFARVRQLDTMKRKQFVKGINQIAQEGAIQIFQEFNTGMEEIIVGVVGVLQFDVLKYRLENEYNVEIRLENLPYEHIRWIANKEEVDVAKITGTSDMKKVTDLKGNPLLLFVNAWSVGMTEDRNPDLVLTEFSK